jgi:hypothetical protein
VIGDILPLGSAAGLPLTGRGEAAMSGAYDPELYKIRHSAAHIMAQAVRGYFADVGSVKTAAAPDGDGNMRSGHGVIAGLVACWSLSTPKERDHVPNEYASICRSRRVSEGDLDSSHR